MFALKNGKFWEKLTKVLGGQMELLMKHSHLFNEVKVYYHNHGVNLIL